MAAAEEATINWKVNLVSTWFSQLLSLMGFSFAMSFAAYYIQTLGVTDPDRVKIWTGIYLAAGPLTLAIMGPIWGALGDRYGRRLMLLRANLTAAIILYLMGCVTSVEQLIVLRILQGVFSGTITAAMTLIAVSTPKERHGLALGTLQSAVFIGWMAGSAAGGFLADQIGYANTIKIAGGILLAASILVLVTVREDFKPPEKMEKEKRGWQMPRFGPLLPVMALIMFTAIARRFDGTMMPLFIQELNDNKLGGSATMMGQLSAICCVALTLSSLSMGWLSDRLSPGKVAILSAIGSCIFGGLQFFATDFTFLVIVRSCLMFSVGGLDPAFQVWLTKSTPEAQKGSILGYAVTARSSGWVMASIGSAYLATFVEIRSIFLLTAILFLGLIPLVRYASARNQAPAEAELAD